VNVTHINGENAIVKQVSHAVAFILVNERKDFATFYGNEESRYEGFFVAHNDTFLKTVARITRAKPVEGIELYQGVPVATRYLQGGATEIYATVKNEPVLIYEALKKDTITVRLDMRDQFYIPKWGRNYCAYEEDDIVIVRYSDDCITEPVYLAIAHDGSFALRGEWIPVNYGRDRERNSEPAELYEYVLGNFDASKLTIAFGLSVEEALERARKCREISGAKAVSKKRMRPKQMNGKVDVVAKNLARNYAVDALDALFIDNRMLAGMPWFTKAWVRDELISAPALPKERAHAVASKHVRATWGGQLPVIFGGANNCSDGLGLLAWAIMSGRIGLTEEEKDMLAERIKCAIAELELVENEFGFIPSGPRESWMDSIERVGYPVETQTLYVRTLHLAQLLVHEENERFEAKKKALIENVRKHYFIDGYLHDRLYDETMRPNLFLAAFFAPEILSKDEWESCFDKVLPALWLEWGGLASVDTRHECYCNTSAGEHDTSYHNGDSWFFVNNIAALVMHNINEARYAEYIDGILDASTNEILWHNYAGCPGEISSAKALESWGCGLQGFSAAAYVYLADHVPLKRRALRTLFARSAK
jgi:hypothetical protein